MPETTLTRRRLLRCGSSASAALALAPALRAVLADHHRRFRIGACDWSIDRKLDPDALRFAAEIGLDGVQVSFDRPGVEHDLRRADVRDHYERLAERHGVRIASLAMGVLNEVPYASGERTQQWVLDAIDTAHALGLGVILLAFFGDGDINGKPDLQDRVIAKLAQAAPYAEKRSVVLGIESWMSAEDHLRIIDAVGSPAVRVYYDVANSHKMGYDIYAEIRRLGDLICEFHMKENGFLLGEGRIDFEKVRAAIDDIGYSGWLVIEGAKAPGRSTRDCYLHNNRYLRSLFPAA